MNELQYMNFVKQENVKLQNTSVSLLTMRDRCETIESHLHELIHRLYEYNYKMDFINELIQLKSFFNYIIDNKNDTELHEFEQVVYLSEQMLKSINIQPLSFGFHIISIGLPFKNKINKLVEQTPYNRNSSYDFQTTNLLTDMQQNSYAMVWQEILKIINYDKQESQKQAKFNQVFDFNHVAQDEEIDFFYSDKLSALKLGILLTCSILTIPIIAKDFNLNQYSDIIAYLVIASICIVSFLSYLISLGFDCQATKFKNKLLKLKETSVSNPVYTTNYAYKCFDYNCELNAIDFHFKNINKNATFSSQFDIPYFKCSAFELHNLKIDNQNIYKTNLYSKITLEQLNKVKNYFIYYNDLIKDGISSNIAGQMANEYFTFNEQENIVKDNGQNLFIEFEKLINDIEKLKLNSIDYLKAYIINNLTNYKNEILSNNKNIIFDSHDKEMFELKTKQIIENLTNINQITERTPNLELFNTNVNANNFDDLINKIKKYKEMLIKIVKEKNEQKIKS